MEKGTAYLMPAKCLHAGDWKVPGRGQSRERSMAHRRQRARGRVALAHPLCPLPWLFSPSADEGVGRRTCRAPSKSTGGGTTGAEASRTPKQGLLWGRGHRVPARVQVGCALRGGLA